MPTETLVHNERKASEPVLTPPSAEDDALRTWARQHVERVHRFKLHLTAYILGMIVLTPVWALAEWSANGGFERFSDNSYPGDWEPWIVYPALGWGAWVGFLALRAYFFDKPPTETEAEIERTIARAATNVSAPHPRGGLPLSWQAAPRDCAMSFVRATA